jgi:hypothetical protein
MRTDQNVEPGVGLTGLTNLESSVANVHRHMAEKEGRASHELSKRKSVKQFVKEFDLDVEIRESDRP